MKGLKPPRLYVHERVWADERSAARLRRTLPFIEADEVLDLTDAGIPDEIAAGRLPTSRRRLGKEPELWAQDPALVFGTFRFEDPPSSEEVSSVLEGCPEGASDIHVRFLLGDPSVIYDEQHRPEDDRRIGMVCRHTYHLHSMCGCLFRCHYCGFGRSAVITLNLEEFAEAVCGFLRERPWLKVLPYDINGDVLALEPEYGATEILARKFRELGGRYLCIHTKSDNVQPILPLADLGSIILLWTLQTSRTVELFEPGTATCQDRIRSAELAYEAGFPVRYKFKPIIPVRGWQDDARETIARAFRTVRPEVVSMCTLAWMDAEDLPEVLDASELDPEMLASAMEARERMRGVRTGPFPPETREEMYRFFIQTIREFDPEVPISLSTEAPELWEELGPELGMRPADYFCACGPACTPGRRMTITGGD